MTATVSTPTFDTPLRTYVVLHTYFKSLLNGVQGGHACVEMSVKYNPGTPEFERYQHWARVDKTLLYLDGGVSFHMHAFLEQLKSLDSKGHSLPWAHFVEDEATLEGMLTAVAVILPESISKASAEDWAFSIEHRSGAIHDDLLKLGRTSNNFQLLIEVIEWVRSRPLAS